MTAKKYPRTFHLPWSPGATSDDKTLYDLRGLKNGELVVTEKMDGGNFTMTREQCYGRSPFATANPWDGLARAEWLRVRHDIPKGWRVCGESLEARRSIAYDSLPGPFLVFGMWSPDDTLISWDSTREWAELLDLPVVPELYRGDNLDKALTVWDETLDGERSEGYVVGRTDRIDEIGFPLHVAKYVRANHVRTSDDWRHRSDFARNGISRWGDNPKRV